MAGQSTSTGSKPERRRHPRAITRLSADVTAAARSYPARVINLSMGGALLDFRRVVPQPAIDVGDRVGVNIRRRGGVAPLAVEGKAVLWNVKSSSEPLLAVQFDEVTGEPSNILEELIEDALVEIAGRGGLAGVAKAVPSGSSPAPQPKGQGIRKR